MSDEAILHCPIKGIDLETSNDVAKDLVPLIERIKSNTATGFNVSFPRGTLTVDGRLDLCKQNLGAAGCRIVTDALIENRTVVSLLLGTNGVGNQGADDVAKLIERNDTIRIVYLGCNYIGRDGVTALAEAVASSDVVTGLWLKRNPIGDEGAYRIAEMLRKNRSLRVLDLVNTQISLDGLKQITDALIHNNRSVQYLYLGGNQIDEEGARLLAEVVESNATLKALMLNVNHLADEGAKILAKALIHNSSLVEIGLASNSITTQGGVGLLEAVANHPALSKIDLGYSPSTKVLGGKQNSLGDEAANAVENLLKVNRRLAHLDLRRNGITDKGKKLIIKGLKENTSLQELVLDGKQDPEIAWFLKRNREARVNVERPRDPDLELIRSVYR